MVWVNGSINIVPYVVVPSKIMQIPQPVILDFIIHPVVVTLSHFAEMAHVMEEKDVGIVQWIVGHVLHKQVQQLIQLLRQGQVCLLYTSDAADE